MKKIVLGWYGFRCEEESSDIYMLDAHVTLECVENDLKDNGEEVIINDNEFYCLLNRSNLDDETLVFCFIYNGRLVIGETDVDCDDIDFYNIDCEDVYDIPTEIKEKALKYCYHLCDNKYAKF